MTLPTKAILPAPSVKEADGEFLRPDMMPLGPTVAIRYADMRSGDTVTLIWTCADSNEGHWRGERVLGSDNEECTFIVPFFRLLAAETFVVTGRYVVRRANSATDEESAIASFTVRNYETLNEVYIYDEYGELLNGPIQDEAKGPIDPGASWFDVGFPEAFEKSLQAGDEVVIWLRGSAYSQITTQLEPASTTVSLRITDDAPRPIRLRFGKRIVVANYGDSFWAFCEVVRRSGYIQHEMVGGGWQVGRYAEDLTPVLTPDLLDEPVVLDELNDERGVAVSLWNQSETAGTTVRFFLDGSGTDGSPGGIGAAVDGWLSWQMLEQHADFDCWLYGVAFKDEVEVARSPRRLLTVRRSRKPVPFPVHDDSLERPRIDGLTSGALDLPKFPGGPLARVPHAGGFSVGDLVTITFRTADGLLTWSESTPVADDHTHEDVVQRVSMPFLAYSQDRQGWLYYSITSAAGGERFSPLCRVYIGPYIPRIIYYQALWAMNSEGTGYLEEILPDAGAQLGLSRQNMRLYVGDKLVLTLQGHRADTSMQIHITIDEESRDWLWIDLPQDLVSMNAGYGLFYRATKISGSYIEHTHWKAVSILPWPADEETSAARISTTLPDIFRTASSLPRRFHPAAVIPATSAEVLRGSVKRQSDRSP
jgi:hypothetical protein